MPYVCGWDSILPSHPPTCTPPDRPPPSPPVPLLPRAQHLVDPETGALPSGLEEPAQPASMPSDAWQELEEDDFPSITLVRLADHYGLLEVGARQLCVMYVVVSVCGCVQCLKTRTAYDRPVLMGVGRSSQSWGAGSRGWGQQRGAAAVLRKPMMLDLHGTAIHDQAGQRAPCSLHHRLSFNALSQ